MALNPRVLIQGGATNVLSVSAPGKDVTTALLNEMQFDSRWAQLQLFMVGSITVSGIVGAENVGNVSFGVTLAQMPIIRGYAVQSPNAYGWSFTVLRGNSADYWWSAEVTTTGASFRNNIFGATLTFHYVIFERPSG